MFEINHYNDALFKDNLHSCPDILKALINGVVNAECSRHKFQIKELQFLDPETKTQDDVKKSIQDVLVNIKTTDGEDIVCGLELQTYSDGYKAFCVRIRHYDYNLFSRNKLKEGQEYKDTHIPNLLQIWLVKDDKKFFEKNPDQYHFCVQGIDSRDNNFAKDLGQDDHFVNINYFEERSDCGYEAQNEFEHIMMYFTCKNDIETATYIKDHKTHYLKVLLENEKMFHNDPEKMGVYMKLEELERRIKTESEARKKAEADKAKAEAEAKAKDEALQKSEAEKAKLLAILAENGINITSD